jgi:hypothetical protein
MKLLNDKKVIAAILLTTTLFAGAALADQSANGWNLVTGGGAVTAMSYSNPKTYLNNQEVINLQLNAQGVPQRGIVKFHGGVERDLTSGEVTYYWDDLAGAHALWSYLESQGKLASVDVQSGPIQGRYYGKLTRVTTKTDKELFGKLERLSDNPDGFSLVVDGACCGALRFERGAVTQLQQMK